jgi:hypothetical protein
VPLLADAQVHSIGKPPTGPEFGKASARDGGPGRERRRPPAAESLKVRKPGMPLDPRAC